MDNLVPTIIIACFLVLIAIGLLAVGWLVRGKSILRSGACGLDPTKQKNPKKGCGTESTCDLCKKNEDDVQKK